MEKRLEQKIARQAERKLGKKAAGRAALRTIGGVAVGIGLYLGFTLLSAPTVEAQTIQARQRNEVISQLQEEVNRNAEKKDIFEKMRSFADDNYAAVVIVDAIEGEGALLEEMGSVIPTVQATGLTEDEIAEAIVDEAAGDNEEIEIPFAFPRSDYGQGLNFNFD